MSSPFVTLTHDDPEFRKYLLGNFSRTHRALPVETFSRDSSRERVTFRLVPLGMLQKPAWWIIYFKACRTELLGLTLGPFAVTLIALKNAPVDWWTTISAACGLFFVHVTAFLFNDFRDHMVGVDLANRKRGSQVIQRGWASARAIRAWAWVNGSLALAFGAPALYYRFQLLGPIVLAAALIVLSTSWISAGLARRGASDLLVFFGLGPLLTSATAVVATGSVPPAVWLLGMALGFLAALALQIRQLENLFRAGRSSFRTYIGAFEFDRVQRIVIVEGVLIGFIQLGIGVAVFPNPWATFGFLFATFPLLQLLLRIYRAASPLSSALVKIGRQSIVAHVAICLWWAVGFNFGL